MPSKAASVSACSGVAALPLSDAWEHDARTVCFAARDLVWLVDIVVAAPDALNIALAERQRLSRRSVSRDGATTRAPAVER